MGSKAAAALSAQFLKIDVTDPISISEAFKIYSEKKDSLDLLINNAGVYLMGSDGQPSVATMKSIRETFEVNFFGVINVTQVFLPLLKKVKGSQILNISSGMGSQNLLLDPTSGLSAFPMLGYSSSKAALNTLTILLSNELKDTGIKVNSVCPGYTATDLNGNSGTQSPEASAKSIVPIIMSEDWGTGAFAHTNGFYPW